MTETAEFRFEFLFTFGLQTTHMQYCNRFILEQYVYILTNIIILTEIDEQQ